MVYNHKIAMHKNGGFNFAQVWVEVTESSAHTATQATFREESRQIDVSGYALTTEWIEAAILGATESLNYSSTLVDSKVKFCAEIVKIVGTTVETNANTVKCASALATWKALFPDGIQPELIFDNEWKIIYPQAR